MTSPRVLLSLSTANLVQSYHCAERRLVHWDDVTVEATAASSQHRSQVLVLDGGVELLQEPGFTGRAGWIKFELFGAILLLPAKCCAENKFVVVTFIASAVQQMVPFQQWTMALGAWQEAVKNCWWHVCEEVNAKDYHFWFWIFWFCKLTNF